MLDDPLLSWRDGPVKHRVLDAVTALAAELPPARRIAAFDHEGTLCCERPLNPWTSFLVAHWREMVTADPALAAEQPYKAAAVGDFDYFGDLPMGGTEARGWIAGAFAGARVESYAAQVERFTATIRHPRFPGPFPRLAYEPQRELLDLLRDNGFTVFIWAADRDFARVVSPATYGVPGHQVLGPAALVRYVDGVLRRTDQWEPLAGSDKLLDLVRACGYPPVFAVGNADDDLELLRLARFPLVIRHDDAEREYAYDDGARDLLATSAAAGWTTVSMRTDLSRIFPE